MIRTENLSKYFDDFCAVDRINLHVQSGEILALLGPNGAGKTTTVRLLSSILKPSVGKAFIDNYDVVENPKMIRRKIGVLTEHHGLYKRMRIDEYLGFFAELYEVPLEVTRSRVESMLDRFQLKDAREKRLGEFSKGMRQKLAMMRALLHDPPVLLLDEPTSAMDPESSRLVRNAILDLKESGRTIVICTHNLFEVEQIADRVAIIKGGKIILNDHITVIKQELLGERQFIVRLASQVPEFHIDWPEGVRLINELKDQLVLEVDDPEKKNPVILQKLLEAGLHVLTFEEVGKNLEKAYLDAVESTVENNLR